MAAAAGAVAQEARAKSLAFDTAVRAKRNQMRREEQEAARAAADDDGSAAAVAARAAVVAAHRLCRDERADKEMRALKERAIVLSTEAEQLQGRWGRAEGRKKPAGPALAAC